MMCSYRLFPDFTAVSMEPEGDARPLNPFLVPAVAEPARLAAKRVVLPE